MHPTLSGLKNLPAVPASAGIVAGIFLYNSYPDFLLWLIAIAATGMFTWFYRHWFWIPVFSSFLLLGAVLAMFCMESPRATVPEQGVEGAFTFSVKSAIHNHASQTLFCQDSSDNLIAVNFTENTPVVQSGDSITVTGMLLPLDDDERLVPNGYLKKFSSGAVGEITVGADRLAVITRPQRPQGFFQMVNGKMLHLFINSPLASRSSDLLASAWLGNDNLLSSDVLSQMRDVGLAHLLCVSGFHVAMVAFIVNLLLTPLKIFEKYSRVRYLLCCVAIWFFGLTIGLEPSVLRACTALTLYNVSLFLNRLPHPVNNLCLALITCLCINPLWLYSVALQLSFCSVAGILFLSPHLNPLRGVHTWWSGIGKIFAATLGATIGALPVSVPLFGKIPLMFLPANIAAGVIFPFFIVTGALVCAAFALGVRLSPLIFLTDTCAKWFASIAEYISSIPGNTLHISGITSSGACFLAVGIVFFGIALYSRGAKLKTAWGVASVMTIMASVNFGKTSPVYEVWGATYSNKISKVLVVNNNEAYIICSRPSDADIGKIRNTFSLYLRRLGLSPDDLKFLPRGVQIGQVQVQTDNTIIIGGDTLPETSVLYRHRYVNLFEIQQALKLKSRPLTE